MSSQEDQQDEELLSQAGSEYEYHEASDEDVLGCDASPGGDESGVNLSASLDVAKVLMRGEVEDGFRLQVRRCAETCNVPESVAAVLLREFKFNHHSVTESWFTDPDALLAKLKIKTDPCEFTLGSKAEKKTCMICVEDKTGDEMVHMGAGCGHEYCLECCSTFFSGLIEEGSLFGHLKCMEPHCNRLASQEFLCRLLGADSETMGKYRKFLLDQVVAESPALQFCPNRSCDQVLQIPQGGTELDVQCNCGCKFCVGCLDEGHAPVSCLCLRNWKGKDADDSMTATWLKANTKDCPKCNSQIEKNGGCNHMTCKKCRYEFCWLCFKDWRNHAGACFQRLA